MKSLKLSVLILALILGACSSTKVTNSDVAGEITPINAQKLTTNFKRKGIKLEWECAWGSGLFGATDAMCVKGDIKAIEVTGVAPSFGNSEVQRENAYRVAELTANRKLIEFLQKDVSSSTTVKILSKNVEKANDNIRSRISASEVAITDEEAEKSNDTNVSNRTNINETVRTVTESINTNSQKILRGVHIVDESIVDRQTVSVTIRWDKNSKDAVREINRLMR